MCVHAERDGVLREHNHVPFQCPRCLEDYKNFIHEVRAKGQREIDCSPKPDSEMASRHFHEQFPDGG